MVKNIQDADLSDFSAELRVGEPRRIINRRQLQAPHDIGFFLTARPGQRPRLATITEEIQKLFGRLNESRN